MIWGPWLDPWYWSRWHHPRFFPSHVSSFMSRRWFAMENSPSPVIDQIRSVLARHKLRYFSSTDMIDYGGPCWLSLLALYFELLWRMWDFFLRKRLGKKVSQRSFSTTENVSPILFVTWYKNIHSNLTASTTAAQLSWGYIPAVLLILIMFCSHVFVRNFIQSSLNSVSPMKPPI